MPLPDSILSVLDSFRSMFRRPTFTRAVELVTGAVLARGRRTVASALRAIGRGQESDFSSYHQVLNRASWSALEGARRLLSLLVRTFAAPDGITVVIDEHLERRWGPRIRKRGHYRDALASSKGRSVSTSGLRWIVASLLARPRWASRAWALPFLSVLQTTPSVSAALGLRHKTVAQWARRVVSLVRRALPQVPITLVGDSAYSAHEVADRCGTLGVELVVPLRWDARLFAPPPEVLGKRVGRPRGVGERLPLLSAVLEDEATVWEPVEVAWYGGERRRMEVASGTGLWYRSGYRPVAARWVITRDPAGELEPRAYMSTKPESSPCRIVEQFVGRWALEVTFEEARAHLGIETQRQYSDKAIERTTPCLFGLYSVVAVCADGLAAAGRVRVQTTAWYRKASATFADALAAVRREIWRSESFRTSALTPDPTKSSRLPIDHLIEAACYSH